MKTLSTTFIAALLAVGCSEFEIQNKPPVASAQLLVGGMPVADLSVPIDYAGMPLAITLDGNASDDPDGSIVKYLWQRTGISPQERYGDAGVPIPQVMWMPGQPVVLQQPPAYSGDPMPVAAPQLSLMEGLHQYTLWVTDNERSVSEPVTLEFEIKTPTNFMPVQTCVDTYMNDAACEECVCTPAAMMGCHETYQACFENADPMFVTLCTAIVACALEKGCVGGGCYMPTLCQAEIDAGSMYMGGTIASCAPDMAATNPCAAASALGRCSGTVDGVAGICALACGN